MGNITRSGKGNYEGFLELKIIVSIDISHLEHLMYNTMNSV